MVKPSEPARCRTTRAQGSAKDSDHPAPPAPRHPQHLPLKRVHPTCHCTVVRWVPNAIAHKCIQVQGWRQQNATPFSLAFLACAAEVLAGFGWVFSLVGWTASHRPMAMGSTCDIPCKLPGNAPLS